jgi:hypothetical protein
MALHDHGDDGHQRQRQTDQHSSERNLADA